MSDIQKLFRDHRDEFDDAEPPDGHFERFAARLHEEPAVMPVRHRPARMLKIAAAIIILITGSVAVFDLATREIRERYANDGKEHDLPVEIREAVQYYDNQAATQLAMLNKMADSQVDAHDAGASALREISSLDATTAELKMALQENPGNERILDAIVRNQRMKEIMLNTIINQLSQVKKY
jgi:hypothetical protein